MDDSMNKKEIIDWLDWNDVRNTYPKWVWAGNIFCLALGLWVIFWL